MSALSDRFRDPVRRATRPGCTGCSTTRVVLPQAAQRLDTRRELWPDEVRVRVETLNLDAASFRQLETAHARPATVTPYAVRCSRSSPPAARCRTP